MSSSKLLQRVGIELGKVEDIRGILEQLDYDKISEIRHEYDRRSNLLSNMMEHIQNNMYFSICSNCGVEKNTYKDLPEHWGYVDTYLLCDKCLFRWVERWDKEPDVRREI